jgi:DNA-binding LytR/AlgR family response regulator
MIRVLLVDDEDLARQSLRAALERYADLEIVGEATNGLDALNQIEELRPDAVFLDIEMPGMNGLDVVRNLAHPPRVIFATAYDQYAVAAFEANAVDYILKPLDPARLHRAVGRLRESVSAAPDADTLRKLLEQFRPSVPQKLAARRGKRIVLLSPKEVVRASIDDKLVFLHTSSERFLTDRTVAELEAMLAPAGFFRISRGELVNLEYVRELIPWFSGTARIRLTDGQELDVSRERARELRSAMGL